MSIECVIGGQWEVIHHAYGDNVTNGYTSRFTADGDKFRRLRFFLGFAGQSLHLSASATSMFSGAINYQQRDGSGNYHHPHRVTNTYHGMAQRGTGWLKGHMIPRHDGSESGWLMTFRGFSGLGSDWTSVETTRGIIAGRIYWWRNPPVVGNWDFEMGFSSLAGEAGAYQLIVEGER